MAKSDPQTTSETLLAVNLDSATMFTDKGVYMPEKPQTSVVTVPREALEFVLQYGCFQDDGPFPEGWSTPEMKAALADLENALKDALSQ